MTDKKYTDEEIIKALEYCNADISKCDRCVLQRDCESNPFYSAVAEHALDLINRQKAEIERLRAKVETRTQEKLALGRIYKQKLQTVKYEAGYEAYKEFAERIRACCDLNDDLPTDAWLSVTADIDCVLKEMIGEK